MQKSMRQRSLEKYDKMIAYAERQPQKECPDHIRMTKEISLTWYADSCPYCQKFVVSDCRNCPLLYGEFDDDTYETRHCCRGLWTKMDSAKTWKTWLRYANLIRKYIEDPELFNSNWHKYFTKSGKEK